MKVKNVSGYAFEKEYIVARPVDGELWFWGAWSDKKKADATAKEVGGIVLRTEEVEAELAYDKHGFCVA